MSSSWSSAAALATATVPLVLAVAAALSGVSSRGQRTSFSWARIAAGSAFALAVLSAGAAAASGTSGPIATPLGTVRVDVTTYAMLLLVTLLGAVVVSFSATYLRADAAAGRYERALMATLASVTMLVVTNHLLVLALAWTATSFALHILLTHFSGRTQALVAAHKKFMLGRLADVCMLAAVVVLGEAAGTLDIDAVGQWASQNAGASTLRATAALVVAAVVLKSAQLPFHGWLTQVMEAPTPVSALLHAGIVNIGGFVVIRLAPLMSEAHEARAILVVFGTASAVFASLVMTTRVSIKVALAWSTCAQMGFMLVECGLGQWHLALLHLLAHSAYKAHAFLSAGTEVERWKARDLVRSSERPRAAAPWLIVAQHLSAVAFVAGVLVAMNTREGGSWSSALALVVPAGLAVSATASSVVRAPLDKSLRLAGRAALFVTLLFGWHLVAGRASMHSALPAAAVPTTFELAVVALGFGSLAVIDVVLGAKPHAAFSQELRARLFAGFYLDEIFTRTTFELWPPRLPPPSRAERPPVGYEAPSSAKAAS